ncbi:hypothetical protein [Novosphingobium sp. fls2-241-R2A-195]|uniref:hypothetical protein n=1 Tax=Novosphingobium sp. fls2-241-R2A-195 TaxID=3040296 RepID=UPI00254D6B76|nr:hypothetical protein [Novosphingobium sp. fls2-241-R2A-195]
MNDRTRAEIIADDDRIFAILVDCAETGKPCPSNEVLAATLGFETAFAGTTALRRLAKRGLILIERYSRNRIVTIVETGKRTAGDVGKPHWRDRDPAACVERKAKAKPAPAPVAPKPEPIRVDREPCIRCGTRADIGCKHSRRPAPALLFPSVHR